MAAQNISLPSSEDSKSLKIWSKAVIAAPLSNLIREHPSGFDLVKILLEKLW